MNQDVFLKQVADWLEAAGIPYMVAGSHGSGYHGQARATNDVDMVIDPTPEQLDRFVALLGGRYYLSREAARDALRHRTMVNLIDVGEGLKADLIIRKERPFSLEEFRRRQVGTLYGRELPIVSAEDVILSKLEWDKITPSERQLRDALNVAVVQWPRLDREYLRKWAAELGVSESLEGLLRKAEDAQPPPAG
jgi:hypothetical protein